MYHENTLQAILYRPLTAFLLVTALAMVGIAHPLHAISHVDGHHHGTGHEHEAHCDAEDHVNLELHTAKHPAHGCGGTGDALHCATCQIASAASASTLASQTTVCFPHDVTQKHHVELSLNQGRLSSGNLPARAPPVHI